MPILIHFDRSEACAEAHGSAEPERVTVPYDASDGTWAQLTYGGLRTQDGALLAELGDDGCWEYDGGYFSDLVIEFIAREESDASLLP